MIGSLMKKPVRQHGQRNLIIANQRSLAFMSENISEMKDLIIKLYEKIASIENEISFLKFDNAWLTYKLKQQEAFQKYIEKKSWIW
jgi:hypothetical protein